MLAGFLFALAAGLMWGLVFVSPTLLSDYPAAMLVVGRYLAFGLVAVPLACLDRRALRGLRAADWVEAARLSAMGNFLYYLCLAGAIQRAGGPLPTMIIGTLPVAISVCSNLRDHRRDGRVPWRRLLPSLGLIAAGLACVNSAELSAQGQGADLSRYVQGAVLATAAVACWTWYPLRNADWLRAHADRSPRAWVTAQGLVTLPMALLAGLLLWLLAGSLMPATLLGPRPLHFVGLMLAVGLLASWLGNTCWNEASQRLPTSIAGQLIVFESLVGLAYTFILRGHWPPPLTLAGAALLMAGVCWALRIKPVRALESQQLAA